MCLSGQQREKLQDALLNAFPTLTALEQMSAYGLNQNLRTIASEGNLKKTVFELIQEREAKWLLDELVINAIMQNPTNVYLQNLANIINDIPSLVNSHEFSKDWNLLLRTLQKIEFDLIKEVLTETLYTHIKERQNLDDIDRKFKNLQKMNEKTNRKSMEIFMLKKLLLVEYEELNDGTKTILKFAQQLASKIDKKQIYKELNDWINKIVDKYRLNIQTFSESNFTEEIHSYLLIIIQPEDSKYRIHLYLISNEEDKDSIEPIDINPGEKGFLCCNFDDIKDRISDWIKASFKKIYLYRQYKKIKIECDLTIQFFLPIKHLNTTVEQWKMSHDLDLLIGEEYRVVVRSYDRVKDPEMGNYLIKGIKRLNDVRKQIKSPISEEVCEHLFEHLKEKELDTLIWKDLRHKLQENKIGLKLYCSLPPNKQYNKLYEAILRSGIPIVIWKRDSNLLEQEFKSFLKISSLKNCQTFFKLLQEMRQTAYRNLEKGEDYLGYHLGVLYEEPNLEDFPDLKTAIVTL